MNLEKLLVQVVEYFKQLISVCEHSDFHDENSIAKINELIKKCETKKFTNAIVALVKAGKSTFLNTQLGHPILPENSIPETSSLVSIEHTNPPEGQDAVTPQLWTHSGQKLCEGSEEIYNKLKEINLMCRENRLPSDEYRDLLLKATIPALKSEDKGDNVINFVLKDTPGVNEANPTIKKQMNDLLLEADQLIYLLDYTKLGTDDEVTFLRSIQSLRPELMDPIYIHKRSFFIINKIDQQNSSGLKPEDVKEYVSKFLEKHLHVSVPVERILTTSTQQALWSRLYLNKVITPDVLEDLKRLLFGLRCDDQISDEEMLEAVKRLAAKSNFDEIETRVIKDLRQNAVALFLQTVFSDLNRVSTQILTNLNLRQELLKSGTEEAKRVRNAFTQTIQTIQNNFRIINEELTQRLESMSKICSDWFDDQLRKIPSVVSSINLSDIPTRKYNTEEEALSVSRIICNRIIDRYTAVFTGEKIMMDNTVRDAQRDLLQYFRTSMSQMVKDNLRTNLETVVSPEKLVVYSQLLVFQETLVEHVPQTSICIQFDGDLVKNVLTSSTETVTKEVLDQENFEKTIMIDEQVVEEQGPNPFWRGTFAVLSLGISTAFTGDRYKTRTVKKPVKIPQTRVVKKQVSEQQSRFELDPGLVIQNLQNMFSGYVSNIKTVYIDDVKKVFDLGVDHSMTEFHNQIQQLDNSLSQEIAVLEQDQAEQEKKLRELETLMTEVTKINKAGKEISLTFDV